MKQKRKHGDRNRINQAYAHIKGVVRVHNREPDPLPIRSAHVSLSGVWVVR